MHKLIVLLVLVGITATVRAQYPGYVQLNDPVAFKLQFSAASQTIQTIQSDFTQEKNLSMLSEKIISKGKFWFKKQNLVRMEYSEPFQYLMILNNGNIYVKNGAKENTVGTKSNKLFQQINRIVIDCVKGSALDNPDFIAKIFEGKTNWIVELTPKAKTLGELFQHINITVDRKDFTASVVAMYEQGGDYTIIHFINKELNATIPDALFVH